VADPADSDQLFSGIREQSLSGQTPFLRQLGRPVPLKQLLHALPPMHRPPDQQAMHFYVEESSLRQQLFEPMGVKEVVVRPKPLLHPGTGPRLKPQHRLLLMPTAQELYDEAEKGIDDHDYSATWPQPSLCAAHDIQRVRCVLKGTRGQDQIHIRLRQFCSLDGQFDQFKSRSVEPTFSLSRHPRSGLDTHHVVT
jgi:hypothetical protein